MLSWCLPRSSPGMWRDTVLEHPMLLVLRTRAMATNVQKILCRVKFKFRWLCAHPRTFLPPTLKDRPEIDNVPEVSASGLSWEQPEPKSVDHTEICDSERRDIARQTVRIPQAPRFFGPFQISFSFPWVPVLLTTFRNRGLLSGCSCASCFCAGEGYTKELSSPSGSMGGICGYAVSFQCAPQSLCVTGTSHY